MSGFSYVFRELLGSIRARSAALLSLAALFVFVCIATFVALLLVGPEPSETGEAKLQANEIVASLSPRLSAEAVDELYLRIRARPDVSAVSFRFAEELTPGSTGGRLFVRAVSAEAAPTVFEAIEALAGITDVVGGEPAPAPEGIGLSPVLRIVLLVVLVASIALSLLLARSGYVALLRTFRGEIRIMRISGVPERAVALPVVGLGLLVGLLAGLLLVVGVYLGIYAAGDAASAVSGLQATGRVLGITVAGLLLSLLLGGLIGLLGASLLSSKEFTPPSRR